MQTLKNKPADKGGKNLTLFAVLCVSALLGTLFGAVCCCFMDTRLTELLTGAEESFFNARRSGDIIRIMLSTLAGSGFYLAAAFALGFSAVSQPFEAVLPFFKGISSGVILTQIYGESPSVHAFAKAAAVFPGIFVTLIVTVLACREAMFLSGRLFKICFQDRLFDGLLKRCKLYGTRFLAMAAAICACAALDCGLSILILGKI